MSGAGVRAGAGAGPGSRAGLRVRDRVGRSGLTCAAATAAGAATSSHLWPLTNAPSRTSPCRYGCGVFFLIIFLATWFQTQDGATAFKSSVVNSFQVRLRNVEGILVDVRDVQGAPLTRHAHTAPSKRDRAFALLRCGEVKGAPMTQGAHGSARQWAAQACHSVGSGTQACCTRSAHARAVRHLGVCTAPQMYDTGNEWEQSRLDGADDISSAYEYITRWGGVGRGGLGGR